MRPAAAAQGTKQQLGLYMALPAASWRLGSACLWCHALPQRAYARVLNNSAVTMLSQRAGADAAAAAGDQGEGSTGRRLQALAGQSCAPTEYKLLSALLSMLGCNNEKVDSVYLA
jgi:hypothetical protein